MKITIELPFAGGDSFTALVIPADIIAWENYPKRNSRKMSELSTGIGLGDLSFLAWASLKRQYPATADFDTWITTVENIEVADTANPK